MKKVGLIIFLVTFAVSVVGRSVERTATWAAQHANNDFRHSTPNRTGARLGEGRKHTPWQTQTKLLEDGSMAVSFDRCPDPPLAESSVNHGPFTAPADHGDRTLSSRAPPSFLLG
jgi:hypothetical protein